jgi:hypothetical protein
MALYEPLDLQFWLVQVFSGNWTIFSIVGVLAVSLVCGMFKMNTGIFTIMLVAFGSILLAVGQSWFMVLLIFILAPLLFWQTRRITE